MNISAMRKICNPLGIKVECKWSDGFLINVKDESVALKLAPLGFEVIGIGIGYDYNAKHYTLLATEKDKC
jgi:hypothetical protein